MPGKGRKLKKLLSQHLRKLGALGGTKRAKNLTAAERSEGARRAVQARWAKKRKA